jgi:hypothetical protein
MAISMLNGENDDSGLPLLRENLEKSGKQKNEQGKVRINKKFRGRQGMVREFV